jgi:hypothetical protein
LPSEEHSSDAWVRRQEVLIQEFVEGWSWEQVVSSWLSHLSELSVSLEPLFTRIEIHDPAAPVGRDPVLSWWPASLVQKMYLRLQDHMNEFPGTVGPVQPDYHSRSGELETVRMLWEGRGNSHKVCAILISASLFSWLHSSRGAYPGDSWPPYTSVSALDQWANDASGGTTGWHHACTQVIPELLSDHDSKIGTLGELVNHLAGEHAAIISNYTAVLVEFKSTPNSLISKSLKKRYAEQQLRHRQWKQDYEARKAIEQGKERELRKLHPRIDEWPNISREEREHLVWSKPTTLVAADFGVSDSAISKKCRLEGIRKPPRGFWAKVDSDKIPHPQGKLPK